MIAAALVLGLGASNAVRAPRTGSFLVLCAVIIVVAACVAPHSGRLVGVVTLAGLAGLAWGSARLDAFDRSPMRAEVGRAARGVAVVTGESRIGRFGQRIPARLRVFDGRPVDERVQREVPVGRSPPQGGIVGRLAVVRQPRALSNGFDERTWLRRQGIHVVFRVDDWRDTGRRRGGLAGVGDRLRTWLRAACAPGLAGERRAVLEGIVLGDDGGLSPGLKIAFRRSGLYHLLAVSGQNVVLLAGGVLLLAWGLGVPRAWAHVAALAAIGAYVLAVGPQPSVIRAAVAGGATSVAWLVARERDPWHVLLLAAVVLLAWNPYTLADAGFQLSFAAVAAIFLAVRPLLRVLEGYPLPPTLPATLAVSTACGVATAPVLWLQFCAVPLLGVRANALVEPAVAPLLGLAFATAAVDPVAPSLAEALAWLDGWVVAYVVVCARAVAALPAAQVHGPAAGAAALVCLVLAGLGARRLR